MLKTILPVVVVCAVFAACQQSGEDQPATSVPDASPLLETDLAFAKMSADSGAVAAFTMYLAEDAVQMPSGASPINGRDDIVAAMASGPDMQLMWEPKHAEVAISGELGWTWGVYEAKFTDSGGEEVSSAGKYVNVWRKQDDGSWRVIVDMGNPGV
ncbi:MAG: DUF4440 domain-containing protein [Rhodothermales bacterium]|jgi:ketosteroid isomerase-like protein